jgi:hypothetical protein
MLPCPAGTKVLVPDLESQFEGKSNGLKRNYGKPRFTSVIQAAKQSQTTESPSENARIYCNSLPKLCKRRTCLPLTLQCWFASIDEANLLASPFAIDEVSLAGLEARRTIWRIVLQSTGKPPAIRIFN